MRCLKDEVLIIILLSSEGMSLEYWKFLPKQVTMMHNFLCDTGINNKFICKAHRIKDNSISYNYLSTV